MSRPAHHVAAMLAAVALIGTAALGAPGPSYAASGAQDDLPTLAGEARRYYESWIDNWTDGPAESLLTNEEREIWDNLEDSAQRKRFIEWFWDRRDPDGRMLGNQFQEAFYERVAYCNERYRGFPRGWKSDRCRVRMVLGEPDMVSRQTYQQLGGAGQGPDFEIWSYLNIGNNRAFQATGGEFLVYFAETRVASYEIYDFRWGAGVWDRNMRLAFEIVTEGSIIDPITRFEAGEARGDYVREISEGTLPAEIPTGIWSALGAGGAVSVPVQIRLGDLLFQPDEGEYVAHLDARLSIDPAGGGRPSTVEQPWEIRLAEADLLELGNGSFVTGVTVPAAAGANEVTLLVQHTLAATEAQWSETVTVGDAPGTAIVVGRTVLPLSATDASQVAVLMPDDGAFPSGGTLVVGAWMRGAVPDPDSVSVQLEAGSGTYALEIDDAGWRGGTGGPLVLRARIPELDAGEYLLRVDFGDGLDAASMAVQITR